VLDRSDYLARHHSRLSTDYEAHNIKGGFRQFVFRPVK
jgi:hypothetical protein